MSSYSSHSCTWFWIHDQVLEWLPYELIYVYYGSRRKLRGWTWWIKEIQISSFKIIIFGAKSTSTMCKYSFSFSKENAPRGAFPKRLARAQSGWSVVSLVGRAGRPLSSEGPARARARARALSTPALKGNSNFSRVTFKTIKTKNL
mgnify:CR=1 FL=1